MRPAPLPAAIVFDAVGTLLHPQPPAPVVYAEVGRRHGSRLSVSEIAPRFPASFHSQEKLDRERDQRTSEERERQRWRDIVGTVLNDVDDLEVCFEELFQYFSRPTAWRCTAEVGPTLHELAAGGHKLALASNYDRRLRTVVAGLPELRPIQHLIISSEVGWRKPAPEFFEAVCRLLGLPPAEILFVGDDLCNDYEGARANGFAAVLFDPRGEAPAGVAHIANLAELLR